MTNYFRNALIMITLSCCALGLLCLSACGGSSTPVTYTKDVTVAAITPTLPAASIDFAPDGMLVPSGGWGDHFSASDITYTLEENMGHTTADFPGGVVSASQYVTGDAPTITQTFYYNGTAIGSRSIILEFAKPSGTIKAVRMYANESDYNSMENELSTIPSVTLTQLSKTE